MTEQLTPAEEAELADFIRRLDIKPLPADTGEDEPYLDGDEEDEEE